MATINTGFIHTDEKIKKDIITDTAKYNKISALGIQEPVDLTDSSVLSFTNFVGSQTASEGEAKVETPFESKVSPVQNGMVVSQSRMSVQALRKSEANGVKMLEAAQKTISQGFGKDLDIIMMHTTSPNDGSQSTDFTVGLTTGSDTLVHTMVTGEREDEALWTAIKELGTNEKEVTGIAVTNDFFYRLADLRDNDGRFLYPQLLMADKENLVFHGHKLVVSNVVGSKTHKKTVAGETDIDFIVGDFTKVVWGTRIDSVELITTGDPDNSGKDLKGHNEVMLRMESWVEYVITDKNAFVVGKKTAE